MIKVNIEFMLIFLFGLTKLLYFHRQGAYMFHEAQNLIVIFSPLLILFSGPNS